MMSDSGNNCCYPINTMVVTRCRKDDMRTTFGIGEDGDPQFTLSTAHCHAVCYAIEGNTVDRASRKNGKGYCEDVSPTLNTQDRHAVVYSITNHDGIPIMEKTETLRSNCHQAIPVVCRQL